MCRGQKTFGCARVSLLAATPVPDIRRVLCACGRGEPVAIKTVMRGGHGKYEMDALKSLLQEARILAKVRHPNVVTCYGGCITDKNVFIVEASGAVGGQG